MISFEISVYVCKWVHMCVHVSAEAGGNTGCPSNYTSLSRQCLSVDWHSSRLAEQHTPESACLSSLRLYSHYPHFQDAILLFFMYMSIFQPRNSVHHMSFCYLWRPKGRIGSPGIGAVGGCELACGCQQSNLGLQKNIHNLNSELSLYLASYFCFLFSIMCICLCLSAVFHISAVPTEVRKGSQIPWVCNYKQL